MANKDITETGVRSVLETMGIPTSFQGLQEGIIGRGEAMATIGSGMAASAYGGLRGLGELARGENLAAAVNAIEQAQQQYTFMPRTEPGRETLAGLTPALEALSAPAEFVGEQAFGLTESPALATGAEIFLDPVQYIAPGIKGAMAITPIIARGAKTVKNAAQGAKGHGLPTELLVEGPAQKPTTPVVQTFTPKNTDKVLANINEVKAQNPEALQSTENWIKMEDEAFGGETVPVPPMQAIKFAQSPEALAAKLQQLTPELKAGVDEGFGYVQQIRDLYQTPAADPALTGRLFLWGILSRGAGPVQQEAAFIDIMENAQPYIDKATRGEFSEADLKSWEAMIEKSLPEGSPAKQVTMNANAAGKLLFALSKRPEGSDQPVLQTLHNILADPNATGRDFRTEFFRLTNKPGIDNKVVSFIGLVGGKDDMLVMDRIQSRNLWDDGRFEGRNIYDGINKSGLSKILGGPRGLLITESMEDGLRGPVAQAYEMIGRPEDASIGRMHWETWVIEGNQAVSHSTLESVRTGTQIGGAVTEGKPGTFSSGTTYRQTVNGPITEYPLSDGSFVRMTPTQQKAFEKFIKAPKNGIVPRGFKVSEVGSRPWYEAEGVNRSKLDEAAKRFENANADGSLKSGAPRPIEGGRSVSGRRGDFLRSLRADRAARSRRPGADDTRAPSGPYTREAQATDGGDGLLTLTPSQSTLNSYQYAGLNAPVIRQVNSIENAPAYNAEMRASLRNNPMAPQVEIKSPEELADMRLFRTDSGSGFAIKPDGDIVAVFASPDEPRGGAYAMLQAAVEAGGRKLDAFNTYLPDIYETVGFRPVARVRWNDEYAPPGWDKKVFEDYQNGEPDVAFFVYDPDYTGRKGVESVPYVDEYDEGVAIQNAELRKLDERVRQVEGR